MWLTALSPSGLAPLSSQHSFRYLAETFSFCLPFSKTCFMPGALSAVVLKSLTPLSPPLSLSPSLSFFHSSSLSHSFCPHSSTKPASSLFFPRPALSHPPSPSMSHPSVFHSNFLLQSLFRIEDIAPHVLHPRETGRKRVRTQGSWFMTFRQEWPKVRLMGPVIWSVQWNENSLL